jgi:hypothetical protein
METTQGFSMELSSVTIRCGCGDFKNIHPDGPCPTPRAVEDNGVIGRWNSNQETEG